MKNNYQPAPQIFFITFNHQRYLNIPLPYDELTLLREVAEGNKSAFREIYVHHHQKLYSFAFFITRSANLAEEITQEIFIKIWMHRLELGGIDNFNAWLKTLVRNHAYTCLHRMALEKVILQNIRKTTSGEDNVTDTAILDREYNRLLEKAISNLPLQQKKVFLLSRQEGMKQEAIAQALGLSINTVKNHMKAALRSIRVYLEGHTDAIVMLAIAFFFAK